MQQPAEIHDGIHDGTTVNHRQAAQKHPASTQDLTDQQGDPYGDPGTATRICMHRW